MRARRGNQFRFTNATYLGGTFDGLKPNRPANLTIEPHLIEVRAGFRFAVLHDPKVEIDGADSSRFTAMRLAALGPLGLAFKKDNSTTYLSVKAETADGEKREAIFALKKTRPQAARAQLITAGVRVR